MTMKQSSIDAKLLHTSQGCKKSMERGKSVRKDGRGGVSHGRLLYDSCSGLPPTPLNVVVAEPWQVSGPGTETGAPSRVPRHDPPKKIWKSWLPTQHGALKSCYLDKRCTTCCICTHGPLNPGRSLAYLLLCQQLPTSTHSR